MEEGCQDKHAVVNCEAKVGVGGTLREKCPNTDFFLVRIFPQADWMREKRDQKKLRIWTIFTQR